MESADYEYDVFISHAVEDKLPIANDLFKLLKEKNLKVWYSGTELGVGDRLTDSIHKNLEKCRFGVVIISPTYLSKIWALTEFFLLLTREKNGQKVILPVLYDITPAELASRSILMAEIFAVHADKGLEHVADVLVREIRKNQEQEKKRKEINPRLTIPKKGWVALLLLMVLTMGGYGFLQLYHVNPGNEIVEQTIQKRIAELQQKADIELQQLIQANNGKRVEADEIKKVYTDFTNTKSYYRNEYTLNTGLEIIRSKRNVEASLVLDMETLSPFNAFTLTSPDLYRCDSSSTNGYREEKFVCSNRQIVTYTIVTSETIDDQYQVKVNYTNPIRLVVTNLVFPSSASGTKRYQVLFTALRPLETYSFIHQDDTWILTTIE